MKKYREMCQTLDKDISEMLQERKIVINEEELAVLETRIANSLKGAKYVEKLMDDFLSKHG